MPATRALSTGTPAARRSSTQSRPLRAGERAQPGRPSTGVSTGGPEEDQISRIDRHAEPFDPSAHCFESRRDDVPSVDDRRCADHEENIAIPAQRILHRRGKFAHPMRALGLPSQSATQPRETIRRDLGGLGENARFRPAIDRLDELGAHRAERVEPEPGGIGTRQALAQRLGLDRKRDDLHRRDHAPGGNRSERRDCRERHGLVNGVQRIDGIGRE